MQYHVNIGALIFLGFVMTGCINPSQDITNTDLASITVKGPDKTKIVYDSMELEIHKNGEQQPKMYKGTDEFSGLTFPAGTKVTLKLLLRGAPSDNDNQGPIVAQTDASKGDLCPPVVDRVLESGNNDIEMKICRVREDGETDVISTGDAEITIDVKVVNENDGSTPNDDIDSQAQPGSSLPPPAPQPDAKN